MTQPPAVRSLWRRATRDAVVINRSRVGLLSILVVVASLARVVVASDQAPPAPTGVIAGVVTDAVSSAVLSGVLIELSPVAAPGAPPPPASARRRQLSDAKGRYAFRNLPAATYLIRATVGGTANAPNGFIQNSSGFPITPYLAGGFGQRIAGGLTRPLQLADGEQAISSDIALWPTGVIAGNVYDESGDPLVEAVVGAVAVTSDGRLTNGPSTRTDDRGAYRLSGLAPGRYLVYVPFMQTTTPVVAAERALQRYEEVARRNVPGPPPPSTAGQRVGETLVATSSSGWFTGAQPLRISKTAMLALPTTFYPGSTTLNFDALIAVKSGDERSGINITVKPERTAAVSGTLSFNGAPAVGYFVRLMPATSGDAALFEVARAQTDSNGAFVFPAVPLGSYTLQSSGGSSAAFSSIPGAPASSRPGPASWVRQTIAVPQEGLSGVALAFRPGIEVRGRVEFVGAAAQPDANAMKNIRVNMPGMQRVDRTFEEPPVAIPDADGAFGPIAVSPGRYVMRLMTGPPSPWQLQSIDVNGRDVAEQPLEVAENVSNVTLTFTDRPASVTVTVSGLSDASSTRVMLFPANRALWPELRSISGRTLSALPSRDGRAVFSNVLPGDYLAVAMSEADAVAFPDATFVNTIAPMTTTLKVSPNAPAAVTLTVKRVR